MGDLFGPVGFETSDKLRCIEREIAMRRKVYPNRVLTRRMTREAADREIAIMTAIRDDYLRSGE